MAHSGPIQKLIDVSGRQTAHLDASLDHREGSARQRRNFRNLDRLAAFKKVDCMPVMQRDPLNIRRIEIPTHFLAHALHNTLMRLIERTWHRQILPGCHSGDFQQRSLAVLDQVHCKLAHRVRSFLLERQLSQPRIGHAFQRSTRDKFIGLDRLDSGSMSLHVPAGKPRRMALAALYGGVLTLIQAFKSASMVGEVSQRTAISPASPGATRDRAPCNAAAKGDADCEVCGAQPIVIAQFMFALLYRGWSALTPVLAAIA